MWVSVMYALTFLASLFALSLFLIRNKKSDSQFVSIGLLVCVNSLGKYVVSISNSLEMAIWATRVMNIGNVFGPVMLIFIIQKLCGRKMPPYIKYPFIAFSVVTFAFSLTIGKSNLYFKDVSINAENGYTYLVKSFGPAYYCYPVLMLLCFGCLVFYIVYAIKRRKYLSYITLLCICSIPTLVVIIYAIELITNSHISYLSIGYLIGALVIQWLFTRLQMFDITANLAVAVDRVKEFGYIEIDRRHRYVKSNRTIRELFPEIEQTWQIDRAIPVTDSMLYTEVLSWALDGNFVEKSKVLHINDRYFNVLVRDVIYGRFQKIGYIIEFVDRTDEYRYTETIKNYNKDLNMEVAKKTAALSYARDRLVIGMAEMAESRDASTGNHIKRTSAAVEIFSQYMLANENPYDLSEAFLKKVARAAPMHDLGKVSVDDSILRKPGKLTDEEYNAMKNHCEAGANVVESVLRGAEDDEFVDIAKNVAWYHHEKWNGAGYPQGLKGEEIPVEARIMALVDVFDALVSNRCYKASFGYDRAFAIIEESLGTHFDPKLGKVFLDCRADLEKLYDAASNL